LHEELGIDLFISSGIEIGMPLQNMILEGLYGVAIYPVRNNAPLEFLTGFT